MAGNNGTGFFDLPPELRTYIYELSNCLSMHHCYYGPDGDEVCSELDSEEEVAEEEAEDAGGADDEDVDVV
jgi:hypothetical protein